MEEEEIKVYPEGGYTAWDKLEYRLPNGRDTTLDEVISAALVLHWWIFSCGCDV